MRYSDVDPIAVLLPPDLAGGTVLFRRDDLEGLLDKPLSQSLPTGKAPNALGMDDSIRHGRLPHADESYDYDFLSASRRNRADGAQPRRAQASNGSHNKPHTESRQSPRKP